LNLVWCVTLNADFTDDTRLCERTDPWFTAPGAAVAQW